MGPRSNGEYLPYPPSPAVREAAAAAARARGPDRAAPRPEPAGISSRRCVARRPRWSCWPHVTSEEHASRGERIGWHVRRLDDRDHRSRRRGRGTDGRRVHVRRADAPARLRPLGRSTDQEFGSGFPYADCGEADWHECFGVDHWLEELFVRSDTTMAVISAVPILARAQSAVDRGDGSGAAKRLTRVRRRRPRVPARAGQSERRRSGGRIRRHAPARGRAPIARVEGVHARAGRSRLVARRPRSRRACSAGRRSSTWCARSARRSCACTRASAAAARTRRRSTSARPPRPIPTSTSSCTTPATTGAEGPYTRGDADAGVNRLIASLDAAGIGPDAQRVRRAGSTWWNVMRDPTQAAHVARQAARAVGDDRVLWGTDSIWYGSPQDQIEAFRTFQITDAVPGRVRLPGAHRRAEAQGVRRQRRRAVRRRARGREVSRRIPPRSRSTAPRSRRSARTGPEPWPRRAR